MIGRVAIRSLGVNTSGTTSSLGNNFLDQPEIGTKMVPYVTWIEVCLWATAVLSGLQVLIVVFRSRWLFARQIAVDEIKRQRASFHLRVLKYLCCLYAVFIGIKSLHGLSMGFTLLAGMEVTCHQQIFENLEDRFRGLLVMSLFLSCFIVAYIAMNCLLRFRCHRGGLSTT